MAFSEALAARVREVLGSHPAYSERKMFGGVCFMLNGNMTVGVNDDDLMVRVAAADWEECLALPHARIMDFTGRPMRGWLFVSAAGTASEDGLKQWVERGAAHALSLPAKDEASPSKRRGAGPRPRSRG